MTQSPPGSNALNPRIVIGIVVAILILAGTCLFVFIFSQLGALQQLSGVVSTPSLAVTSVVSTSIPSSAPGATVTPVRPLPTSSPVPPSPTLTPSVTPTPSRTSTPTRTPTLTRTPTNTPTPDPFLSLGTWTVGASSEITFTAVTARQFRFQMTGGGGEDKMISFYCCGSGGAAWLVNDVWVPVTDPSLTLRIGQVSETKEFTPTAVSRQRFSVGVNDNETMVVHVYYLPPLTRTLAISSTATITPTSPLTTTGSITVTATPTSTSAPTATATLTVTTVVVTPTVPTGSPTSTLTTTTSVVTPTVAATRPAAPKGSVAYRKNDSGIDRVFLVNMDNNTTTPLVDIGPVMDLAMSTNGAFGAWSPDNSMFAYIQTVSPGGSNILRVLDFRANETRALFSSDAGGGLSSPTWSPDGKQIAFVRLAANQRLWAIDVVNANATRCGDKGFCEITTNTQGEQFRGGLSWSKQGLYALAINSTGANDVFTMFPDGGSRTNLTNGVADDSTPAWSPDGKLIAFTSNRGGKPQIYLMNADGSSVRRVSQGDAPDFSPTWSSDGNWIAFASVRDNSTDIYMMDVNGGNVTRLTKSGGDHPIWSR